MEEAFLEAEIFGKWLSAQWTNGWTCWKKLEDEYEYVIRGKVRNTRQSIGNPLIELCVNQFPYKHGSLIMDYKTFKQMHQAIIRHEFSEDKENKRIIDLPQSGAFAYQAHGGIDWYNRNPGDTELTVLNFPQELVERMRECIVRIPAFKPYAQLCFWERDNLFPFIAAKAARHPWYSEAYPPPPMGGEDCSV